MVRAHVTNQLRVANSIPVLPWRLETLGPVSIHEDGGKVEWFANIGILASDVS